MKPKKRVVTTPAGTRPKRTPTVRRIKPAIAPADARRRATGTQPPGERRPPPPEGAAAIAAVRPGIAAAATPALDALGGRPVDLAVELGRGLVLPNPMLVAAGTFGYGIEQGDIVDVDRLGGICTRGTTLKAQTGNPMPRVIEMPAGLLNAIGLQNPGVDAVVERHAPTWRGWRVPVIVNVAGASIPDYVECARRLDGVAGIAGIELNLACPNLARGGLLFAFDPDAAGALTAAVRRATDLPVIAKLSPGVADIRPIARAIEAAGADALSAVNTLTGIALADDRSRPFLGTTYGGLSGPAIKPIALRVVYEVATLVDIPVIAIGGVTALDDVLDYLAVGAVAVQVGTAVFADPTLPVRLVDELAGACRARGLDTYRALIGTALPGRPPASSAVGAEYRP